MLPDFHILCAGTQMMSYAWLSTQCLIEACPKNKKNDLCIFIHLVAHNKRERLKAKKIFLDQPHVSIIEDIIYPDERIKPFDRWVADFRPESIKKIGEKIRRRIQFLEPLTRVITGPQQRPHLGLYHHEWISAVCRSKSDNQSIVIVDTDMFVMDPMFFEDNMMHLQPKSYAAGWIWRTNNSLQIRDSVLYPLGTELFIINPKLHLELDKQKNNLDLTSYLSLKSEFPEIHIENESFIDTLFMPCWLAQLRGYNVDTRFSDLKVCHPGGVGHIRLDYIRKPPSEIQNLDNWKTLNVGRVRLHSRIINLIQNLGMGYTLAQEFLDRIFALEHFIKEDKELSGLWNSGRSLIDGDENIVLVEKLFNQ